MNKRQMEMRLASASRINCRHRSKQRQKRAQWWFQQMRMVVNSAIDWKPAEPEQSQQQRLVLSTGK